LQALWTQARESLNVVTVIFANQTYQILQGEMQNVGGQEPGPKASEMLRIDQPTLNWVSLSKGMGVPATRVDTADNFTTALQQGMDTPGPFLIEAMI
ncbi:MAG: acetolactate synthase large subunit, partial [Candidatus Latescibacteria bacterium]|nr:acetolactate synthase large subunit [Candidatus Latescibacterota bacterium]